MEVSTRTSRFRPALLVLAAYFPLGAAPLEVRLNSGRIHVVAPQVHFLTGRPLDRLRNGAPAAFALQLSVAAGNRANTVARDIERFVLSWDLWEEKFSAVKLGGPRRSASHLSAEAAEAWCVGDLGVAAAGLPADEPIWVKLEVRTEDSVEQETSPETAATISLGRLIDVFSRRPRDEEPRWTAEAGPLRLSGLSRPPHAAERKPKPRP